MTEEVKDSGEQEVKSPAGSESSSQDEVVTEAKTVEVKTPEIDYKAEYEKTKKSYDELNSLVGKHATEKDILAKELETKNSLLARLVGKDEPKQVKDDEFSLLDDDSKFAETIQTAEGAKKLFKLLEKKNELKAQSTIQKVLGEIAEHGQLYSQYPELAKKDSEFAKRFEAVLSEYDLGNSKKGKVVAAKLVANELGLLSSGQAAIKIAEEAKKGIQVKEEKSHMEISKKDSSIVSKKELTNEQKRLAHKFGLSEDEYAATSEKGKLNARGHKTYTLDDVISKKEDK